MELMEKSLYNLIEDQEDVHFSLHMVVDIIVQIARGMCYLHDQGVAHRDLKPQNVVVSRLTYSHNVEDHFCVKLVDFETSKTQVEVSKSNTMTAHGIGTKMYRAPEVYPNANPTRKGRAVWFKADVFSFAMTCAHVLSLKTPFQDMELPFTAERLYDALMNGRRPSLPNKCPPELCALLKDCWNTIPRKRPSFMEICTRLETFRHIYLTGVSSENMKTGESLVFIKTEIEAQSSLQKVSFDRIKPEVEDNQIDFASIIPCTCGRALELLPQPPSRYTCWRCDICWEDWEDGDGKVFHCETCQFDTHFNCAKIKNKVSVFFHHHPLHLLIRNYYKNNPDSICRFCEESTQDCDWVYRCEECDFDVHALCTKYHREKQCGTIHPHLLKLIQCPPHKSFECARCNDEIVQHTWRYSCTFQSCAFHLHPKCITLTVAPFCIFDCSHRLSLVMDQEGFACARCGALGISWFYQCKVCDVAIHPDCVDDILDEEKANWIGAYEKFMLENGSKDDHSKASMILELLDKLPFSDDLDTSSSTSSKSPPVMTTVSNLRLIENSRFDREFQFGAKYNLKLRRKIVAETAERIKVKKMASKEGRQKIKTNLLGMLENLEKVVVDMRSCENVSQDEVQIAASLKQLKEKQHLVKEQIAMEVQAKRSQGPRIAVFCKNVMKENGMPHWELPTKLQRQAVDWEGLWNYALFCEEPGHEHVVDGKWNITDYWDPIWVVVFLGISNYTEMQPLLDCGLQVVMRAMGALAPDQLTEVQSVTIPCLDAEARPWDLRALAQHKDNQNMEMLKRAADSAADVLLHRFNDRETNILKRFGLQRVCYKLTEEGDSPRYRRGALAWLCTEHLNSGFKDGVLEPHPLKYYNVEDDNLIRFPNADPED
ncbi:hypothetical protein KC19_7G084300 [Ceratodon purpureus]|uniref:Protein kinase domain-containing protein n=1 Tax=Ceratodon purpureus TaxID=3225 RepID=A0A8T0H3W6_CERPU|nr:hypothetical protein KC19_7G084300 [Ceratodon purpureus]